MRTTLTSLGLGLALCVGVLLLSGCSKDAPRVSAGEGTSAGKWEYGEFAWTFGKLVWEGPEGVPLEAKTFKELAKKLGFEIKTSNTTAILNGLGNQGWELVTHQKDEARQSFYTFKRRK